MFRRVGRVQKTTVVAHKKKGFNIVRTPSDGTSSGVDRQLEEIVHRCTRKLKGRSKDPRRRCERACKQASASEKVGTALS